MTLRQASIVVLFVLFSGPVVPKLHAQQSPSYEALLVELKGGVQVRRAEIMKPERAVWGMQLQAGDQVLTSDAATASILLVNNSLITLGPSSTMTIARRNLQSTPSPHRAVNVGPALSSGTSILSLRDAGQGEVALLAGLRSGTTGEIMLGFPRKSRIEAGHPTFRWAASQPFDRYVISLYGENGIVWSQSTRETSIEYPSQEPPLEFGRSYFWNVKGERMFQEAKSEDMEFTRDTREGIAAVRKTVSDMAALFNADTANHSYRFIVGTYYEQQGYLHDARDQFESLKSDYSSAPMLHQILGNLYAKMGLKDMAIKEFQAALQLEQSK